MRAILKTSLVVAVLLAVSCSTTKKIKDGSTAYQQKQYAVAVDFLLGEIDGLEEGEQYADLAYKLGDSYKNLNESTESLKWFIEAAKNDHSPDAFWEMAYALKKNERYDDAILTFRRLQRMIGREREIEVEIEKCKEAKRWSQEEQDHPFILEAVRLNSDQSDYAPSLLDGTTLVFTSDRSNEGGETYAWTGNAFSDIYVSDINDYRVQPLEGAINTEHNEGTASFSMDGTQMFFTRCYSRSGDSYCRIYRSVLESGGWSEGEVIFRSKPRVHYRDPVLIENDSVLILTSNDPIGVGEHDLYYSVLLEDEVWSEPELMPTYLNSVGQERFPTWHDERNTLYYSSDYFTGLGGLDIFETSLQEDGSWSRPTNLLSPLNSSEDDYGLIYVSDTYRDPTLKVQAYFTSTRGVFGNDDIYSMIQEHPEGYVPPVDSVSIVEEEIDTSTEAPKTFYLKLQVLEKLYAIKDNPNSYVVGSRKLGGASVKVESLSGSRILETDGSGLILLPIDSTEEFQFLVGKQGYLNKQISYEITDDDKADKPDRYVFETSVIIDRIFEGVEVVIDNIYYDLDKDDIREDAKPALNEIIKILRENPQVKMELASHTDCRGENDYNLDLSERRASSAVTYIQSEGGIDGGRLASTGYGETKFEIDCDCDACTEEEHQINRRTTFKVIR